MNFKAFIASQNDDFLTEMQRRDFLKALGGMAATGLSGTAKGSADEDWRKKGYKDITYDKKWIGPITSAFERHGQRANHDDLINNIHYWMNNEQDSKKKREDLIPGKDYKIYEVIPSTFIEKYCAPNPSKFKKDYDKFTKMPEIQGHKDDLGLMSAQEKELFEKPVIVVFISQLLAVQTGLSGMPKKSYASGMSTIFRAMKYDKETGKYKRNEDYRGATLLGQSTVVMSIPDGVEHLDIDNMDDYVKKTLAHELRHTTQYRGYGYHVVAKKFRDLTGEGTPYIANPMEFGVRIAALKDHTDTGDLQRVFDNAVRKLVYKTGDKLSVPEKMLLASQVQNKFKQWQNGREVDKAIDLLDVRNFANKMGWSGYRYDDPNTEEDDPLKTVPGKDVFQNNIIKQFLDDFYGQDRQIKHAKAVLDNPRASTSGDVDNMVHDFDEELYDMNPKPHQQYRKAVMDYIRNNWNYIVQKGFHKELGIT